MEREPTFKILEATMIATIGKAFDYKGGAAIKTTRPPADHLSDQVTVLWQDARIITPEQRRKAWALIGEISAAYGYLAQGDKSLVNQNMKAEFLMARIDKLQAEAIRAFSLSDVDVTTARLYIDFLIEFVVANGIATKEPLQELADDVKGYVYHCAANKVCAVCRRKADLHHVDRVGMGRDRHDMCHIGMEALPLCREHHMEAHQHGDHRLLEKYHLEAIEIDEKIAKLYKLGKKEQEA